MKRIRIIIYLLFLPFWAMSQAQPKLVVGIVVDQMRQDYLVRFKSKFGKGGFNRLMNEGFQFTQCNINYVPTFTAPGHAAIYTGTTPQINGIVANDWLEKSKGTYMYCVEDKSVRTTGPDTTVSAGQMSPRNLYTTTMTDELRLATNFQGKVVGVCIKDRGSILPAGHAANGAYWFDNKNGNFISSTWYMNELPGWVNRFNEKKYPEQLINKDWTTLLPIEKYTESSADNTPYEGLLSDKETAPVFPHKLGAVRTKGYGTLLTTPFGNTLTAMMAKEALLQEQLGTDSITDFLAISFSSTDYVGHNYGINSIELEDTYLRLDKELEDLFNYLDAKVGKGKYIVFLSADHGCAHNPVYLQDHHIPGGIFPQKKLSDSLSIWLKNEMKVDSVYMLYENQNVYFNDSQILARGWNKEELIAKTVRFINGWNGVDHCMTRNQLTQAEWTWGMSGKIQKGYREDRCGDVIVLLKSGWMELSRSTGTTHGSHYDYDTHIPFLLMGWGIKSGQSGIPVSITDIAPTICDLLKIQTPSGCTGKAVYPLR